MKKYADRMGLVFAVAAMCLTCCLISLSSSQKTDAGSRPLTTLTDLRRELAYVQMLTLPAGKEPVVVDGGEWFFEPAPGDLDASLLLGALVPMESGGRRCWPVMLLEDPESRDTVILDADGGELVRLPCDPGYDPGWAFDILSPLPQGFIDAAAYDPAMVALSLRLISRQDAPAAQKGGSAVDTTNSAFLLQLRQQNGGAAYHAGVSGKGQRKAGTKGAKSAPPLSGSQLASPMALSDGIVDTDGDGMPDDWEAEYGFDWTVWQTDGVHGPGDDADGDGLVNTQELAHATSPISQDTDGDEFDDFNELVTQVVEWGTPYQGTGMVSRAAILGDIKTVSTYQNHTVALKQNGTLVCWGLNSYGQCSPSPALSNQAFIAVSAGASHSLAVRSDGLVFGWGRTNFNLCSPPVWLSNVVSVAAGANHSMALRSNGAVVCWGYNTSNVTNVPVSATNVISVAAGASHNIALRGNGTVVCWGNNTYQQTNVPVSATNVIAVAAGTSHNAALRGDGTVVCWGYNTGGQCTVPAGLTNAVLIACGTAHTLAYTADGRIVAWGQNAAGQAVSFTPYSPIVALDGGWNHSVAVFAPATSPVLRDTDDDGMPDGWEFFNGPEMLTASGDLDGDGLSNLDEYINGGNPKVKDTDGDGITDGDEVLVYGTYPGMPDSDGDGLDDAEELFGRVVEWGTPYTGAYLKPRPAYLGCVIALSAGTEHCVALRSNGTAVCWGKTNVSQCAVPLAASNLVAVAAGYEHTVALRMDGIVVCWGNNQYNQCTPSSGLSNVIGVAAGSSHSLAVRSNGTVCAWGNNGFGKCNVPTNLTGVVAVACGGGHSAALKGDGGVVCWGDNTYQQCAVPINLTNAVSLAAGFHHNVALRSDGRVTCWGWNIYGQCNVPAGITNAVAVSAGFFHSLAVLADGRVICWGRGNEGQTASQWPRSPVLKVGGGAYYSVMLVKGETDPLSGDTDEDGLPDLEEIELRNSNPASRDTDGDGMEDGWEVANTFNLLNAADANQDADNDGLTNLAEFRHGTNPRNRFSDGDGMPDGWEVSHGLDPLNDVDAGLDPDVDGLTSYEEFQHNTAPTDGDTDNDGMPDGWEVSYGLNPLNAADAAQDADGDGLSNSEELSGKVIDWGFNGSVVPSTATNVMFVAGGREHSLALRSDGTVVAWGSNGSGQCEVPSSATNVMFIAGGGEYSVALRRDGTVVAWGTNELGQCEVPSSATNVTSVAVGSFHTLAQRRDGTVVAWGANGSGQCDVPSSATNVISVAVGLEHSLALRRDGTVVAWGANGSGQCEVPSSATNAVSAKAGSNHSLALRRDGTVVAWGTNELGQCEVPSSATNVVSVKAGSNHSLALRRDGMVVAWGANGSGQCEVPSSATNVISVAVGLEHSLALRRDGTVVAWGADSAGQGSGATNVLCAVAIASGNYHSLAICHLNPQNNDSDNDGMPDFWEAEHGFNPMNASDASQDADDDGLTNVEEFLLGTDPYNGDTDFDGVSDGPLDPDGSGSIVAGPDAFPLDPAAWQDTDGDGMPDELIGYSTTGLTEDLDDDNDGMPDVWEAGHGFNPLDPADAAYDYDSDGLTNVEEYLLGTDPHNGDTDYDGVSDGPLDPDGYGPIVAGPDAFPFDPAAWRDTDGDGMPDELFGASLTGLVEDDDDDNDGMPDVWETEHWFNPLDSADAAYDYDSDGLSSVEEYQHGADPYNCDTDYDWISDGPLDPDGEYGPIVAGPDAFPQDPAAWQDTDGDGMPDELFGYSNTGLTEDLDDDNDGMPDVWEAAHGFDPKYYWDAWGDEDYDSLFDFEECTYGTEPYLWDTDDDGRSDFWEAFIGTPLGLSPVVKEADADQDGLPDVWEVDWCGGLWMVGNSWKKDSDYDGFLDFSELIMGTDPAFSVSTAATPAGQYGLSWNSISCATNYHVRIQLDGEEQERVFNTNVCSMVVSPAGTNAPSWCRCEVSAYDTYASMTHVASSYMQRPSNPDVVAWKVCDPFQAWPGAPLHISGDGGLVFEKTFDIYQSSLWPRQFYLSADPDGLGSGTSLYSDTGIIRLEVSDNTGMSSFVDLDPSIGSLTLPSFFPTGEWGSQITVRIYFGGNPYENYPWRPTSAPRRLDFPLYLIGWAPGITFDLDSVPSYDLPDGNKLLLSTNAPLSFLIDYNWQPAPWASVPLDMYYQPFGSPLPYGGVPEYYYGMPPYAGALPPGPLGKTGAYDLDPYSSGGGSWSTIGDAINYYLSFLNFVPERIKERRPRFLPGAVCSVHHDFSGVGKGEFPLDTQCLYEGMLNGYLLDPAGDETDVEEETGFYYPAFPGNEWLSYDPAIYFWKPGETVKTVQAKFTYMGVTIPLGSANVTRTGTGTEEPVTGANLCAAYSWDDAGGCSACGCGNGSECIEKPELHSVGFRIPLGFTGYKTLSGILWFNVKSNQVVVTPSMFSVMSNSTVQATFENNTLTVGCPLPGGRKVIISPISYGVKVSIYNNWADADPARCWTITNVQGDSQKVRFVKYDGAGFDSPVGLDETFEYANGMWSRTDVRRGVNESLQETVVGGVTTTTRLTRDGGPNGPVLSGTMTCSQIVGAGVVSMARDTLSAEWDGVTASWRQTTMSYWDERTGGAAIIGLPKLRQQPDGSWEYRAYDSDGRETLRVLARNASAVPAFVNSLTPAALNDFANAAGLHASVTVSSYENAENEVSSAKRQPRTLRRYEIQGGTGAILTGCEWHSYTSETTNSWSVISHRTERAATQGASKGQSANPVSIERSYAADPGVTNLPPAILCGRPLSRSDEDGSVTRWEYIFDGVTTNLIVTTRRGTASAPDGFANRSTYEVETLDSVFGYTLKTETRLYAAGSPVLSSVVNTLDANGRVLSSLYSDGTSMTNVWGCCQLDASVGRDGIRTSYSAIPTNGCLESIVTKEWMSALPGAQGRYTVMKTYADGLGRETNSTQIVYVNGSADFDTDPLVTLTSYPCGTGNYRVSVSPSGIQTVSRSYYADGWEIDETSSAGVTSVVRRASGGGATVSERIWTDALTGQQAWTRETSSTSWLSDGRRVETVTSEASDRAGATVTSQTVYDILGRMVTTTTPLGVSENFYSLTRLVLSRRTGMPDTRYVYDDATGEVRDTFVDVNGNGAADYAGSDRITRFETVYALDNSGWWRVTTNLVWNQDGSATPLSASVSRERMTGLGTAAPAGYTGVLTAQSKSFNWKGAVTTSSTYTDALSNRVWQVTDVPDSGIDAISLAIGGQTVYTRSTTGIGSSFAYDGFGRQTAFTDGRNNTSVTHYNSLGQVDFTEDAASSRTSYAYDGLGRRTAVTNALGSVTHTAYDALGQPLATWGAAYPVTYEYDTAGRMTSMYTYRGVTEITSVSQLLGLKGQMDRTQWLYEEATGLLTNKVYADGKGPSYTYTEGGRLATRTWARGVVTDYGYDSLGQLVSVSYSDGTPAVANTYDRLGRKLSAITAVSTNTFEYSGLELYAENQNNDRIRRTWTAAGQPYYTFVNPFSDSNPESSQYYAYQASSGSRISSMIFSMPAYGKSSQYRYYYAAGMDRVEMIDCYNETQTFMMVWLYSYESQRDLASSVTNTSFLYDYGLEDYLPVTSMSYDYANDAIGRRTNRVDTLPTSLTVNNAFGYNMKSEVTSATMANGESICDYDSIGNRLFAALDAATNSYTANALNQYSSIIDPVNTVNPVYDLDGNIITNGVWSFRWDAENRMVAAYSNDELLVVNIYDDQSRRIRKVTAQGTRTFLYDGWNPIREIRSQSSEVSTNYYCWGTDLSGTLQGAGGVGGLLAVYKVNAGTTSTYYPCYDANGNITAYVDESGIVRAEYAYDAFGQTISQGGDMASTFSHRFSTKYADDETGLYYYGYRYYAPGLGRWVSRDPVGEYGGNNSYRSVENHLLSDVDFLGLWGTEIHRERTAQWAQEKGISANVSLVIGQSDEQVDKDFDPTIISELTWSRHFNRANAGSEDSRLAHSRYQLDKARLCCSWEREGKDDWKRAAIFIGRALHPLQDWVAHGDFNRRQEMPSISDYGSLEKRFYAHNYSAPGGTQNWKLPDRPDLDASGADGRATISSMTLRGSLGNRDRYYSATFSAGTQRIQLTERLTKNLFHYFQNFVKIKGRPCGACRRVFLNQEDMYGYARDGG